MLHSGVFDTGVLDTGPLEAGVLDTGVLVLKTGNEALGCLPSFNAPRAATLNFTPRAAAFDHVLLGTNSILKYSVPITEKMILVWPQSCLGEGMGLMLRPTKRVQWGNGI
ncbi:hypothetical protein BD779DRAFT_1522887 [Infundibulicybe gibba]|nr:hypothetical protein BD779DRAFT_1522887 [Infundibulicybe gibba]